MITGQLGYHPKTDSIHSNVPLSKRNKLFVLTCQILTTPVTSQPRRIPLTASSELLTINHQFRTHNKNETSFLCHIENYAVMNTGNLHLHEWVVTNNPDLVESYLEFDDSDLSVPLILDCAVPTNTTMTLSNTPNAIVTNKTSISCGERCTI